MIKRKTKKKTVTKVKKPNMAGTSSVMSKTKKKTNRPSASSDAQKNRIFNRRKQRSANDQNPFTSSANPSDIPRKTRKKSIVDKSKQGLATKARKALQPGGASNPYMHSGNFKKGGKAKMMKGGKTTKYMAKGGKTTKYMARGGKTSKYMSKGGRAK